MPGAHPGSGFRRRHRLITAGVAVGTFVLDQATKRLVEHGMSPGTQVDVVGDWVRLTHVLNPGAAFGWFAGNRGTLVTLSLLASVTVASLAWFRPVSRPVAAALGLVLGGALGNLADRLRLGGVVDFLSLGVGETRWPVFNLADVALSLGIVGLAVALARGAGRVREIHAREETDGALAPPHDRG